MKLNKIAIVRSIIFGTLATMAVSCTSNKEKNDALSPTERNVKIRSVKYQNTDEVVQINNNLSDNENERLASSSFAATISPDLITNGGLEVYPKIESTAEFDYIADLSSNATATSSQLAAKASSVQKKAADVPLGSNKKFRLVFVKDGAASPLYNAILSAGEDPDLHVQANQKYQWYAFSVNDPNAVPNIDGSGNIGADDLENKDFMFASGEITTQEDDNYLDITFIRQMAAIDLTLNTRGIFGNITDNSTFSLGTGTSSNFTNLIQTGVYNIYNASFSNLQDADALKGSDMTAVDSRWGNAEKKGRFYTANTSATVSANNLRIRLNSLVVTLDDNSSRTFSANTVVPISHSGSLSFTKGTLSKTNVRLIESGVTVGGLVWARTNLIYESSKLYGSSYSQGNSDAYRFRPNNNYAYADVTKEYWNFGTSTPTSTDYQTVDQCRRVYPEGTWRLPQEQNNPKEMTALSQNTNRTTSRTQVSDGYRHSMIWPGTQAANPAYPDNNLVLSAYGYRNSNGTVQSIPSGSNTGSGLFLYRSNQYFSSNSTATVISSQISNGSFGSTSVPRRAYSEGTPIRCVRNVVNN